MQDGKAKYKPDKYSLCNSSGLEGPIYKLVNMKVINLK